MWKRWPMVRLSGAVSVRVVTSETAVLRRAAGTLATTAARKMAAIAARARMYFMVVMAGRKSAPLRSRLEKHGKGHNVLLAGIDANAVDAVAAEDGCRLLVAPLHVGAKAVSYTHLRAHETPEHLV